VIKDKKDTIKKQKNEPLHRRKNLIQTKKK
jgi:hypothetical protein